MSKRSKHIRRLRHTSRTRKHLVALAAIYATGFVESKNPEKVDCDCCEFENIRHHKKKPHPMSFYALSHYEGGTECDWNLCGYCFPEHCEQIASANRHYSTRAYWRHFQHQMKNRIK